MDFIERAVLVILLFAILQIVPFIYGTTAEPEYCADWPSTKGAIVLPGIKLGCYARAGVLRAYRFSQEPIIVEGDPKKYLWVPVGTFKEQRQQRAAEAREQARLERIYAKDRRLRPLNSMSAVYVGTASMFGFGEGLQRIIQNERGETIAIYYR